MNKIDSFQLIMKSAEVLKYDAHHFAKDIVYSNSDIGKNIRQRFPFVELLSNQFDLAFCVTESCQNACQTPSTIVEFFFIGEMTSLQNKIVAIIDFINHCYPSYYVDDGHFKKKPSSQIPIIHYYREKLFACLPDGLVLQFVLDDSRTEELSFSKFYKKENVIDFNSQVLLKGSLPCILTNDRGIWCVLVNKSIIDDNSRERIEDEIMRQLNSFEERGFQISAII